MYIYTHIYIHISIYIYLDVYTYVSIYICMYACILIPLDISRRSKKTGFGLLVFLAVSNSNVRRSSIMCTSKIRTTIWLVMFTARLTW